MVEKFNKRLILKYDRILYKCVHQDIRHLTSGISKYYYKQRFKWPIFKTYPFPFWRWTAGSFHPRIYSRAEDGANKDSDSVKKHIGSCNDINFLITEFIVTANTCPLVTTKLTISQLFCWMIIIGFPLKFVWRTRHNGWWFGCMAHWWRHQMETFPALLAICAGNSPVPGELPAQRPVTWSFAVFFDLRLNKPLSKQSWGWWFETLSRPLWRHCNG